jgi:hypothetical protein
LNNIKDTTLETFKRSKNLKVLIIRLTDRASKGESKDQNSVAIRQLLEKHLIDINGILQLITR